MPKMMIHLLCSSASIAISPKTKDQLKIKIPSHYDISFYFFREGTNWQSTKNGLITVITVRGGGAAPLALTVSKCEHVDSFLALKFDSLIFNTNFILLSRGLKCIFHSLNTSAIPMSDHLKLIILFFCIPFPMKYL